jgi:hypothetical protein
MNPTCEVRFAEAEYVLLHKHHYRGDGDEHGSVVHAGLVQDGDKMRLLVREVYPAKFGTDYVKGTIGHRALSPKFIHRHITGCRDERSVYLAVHNHHSDRNVDFSRIDLESHARGYPALLGIAEGMPIGALVLGRNSMQADIWLPGGERRSLSSCVVIGASVRRLTPFEIQVNGKSESHDRQMRMFGKLGQLSLMQSRIAVIGLGGIGSILAEYLARLGVGHLVLVDDDRLETSNLSRVVGATAADANLKMLKVEVAKRHALEAAPGIQVECIVDDVAKASVAARLRTCDYVFLAADSMRARLVTNALVHQYLIPATQVGAKVRGDDSGKLLDAMSAVRHLRPGMGCLLCNGFIDPGQLAIEAKTDEERRAQAYGTQEPNPSVITMNAVAAAHAINDFLFDYLGIRDAQRPTDYLHAHYLTPSIKPVRARHDGECCECGREVGSRFAAGDAMPLPTLEG